MGACELLINLKMVMPGDNIRVKGFPLIAPIAMDEGLKFPYRKAEERFFPGVSYPRKIKKFFYG
ncbi:MAG: hypothetical protein CM15mP127_06950 [Gammaproteobacteria bacterium]|nr:MAG: hypothetical protein CM15mP127_06950 [Gammaproteobacteria bacterium]